MKILFVGDVHGDWENLDKTIYRAFRDHPDITHIFHVGDFGDGFRGPKHRWKRRSHQGTTFHWCDGNHENFDLIDIGDLNPACIYQPRGSILEIEGLRFMFMGGATSIDSDWRIPHVTWWPQEDITYSQIAMALAQTGPIDFLVTHERPTSVPVPGKLKYYECGKSNRECLEAIKEQFDPAWWVHGHYHTKSHGFLEDGMEYVCAPIIATIQYAIFDGEKLTCSWE